MSARLAGHVAMAVILATSVASTSSAQSYVVPPKVVIDPTGKSNQIPLPPGAIGKLEMVPGWWSPSRIPVPRFSKDVPDVTTEIPVMPMGAVPVPSPFRMTPGSVAASPEANELNQADLQTIPHEKARRRVVALVGPSNTITDQEVIEAVRQRVTEYMNEPEPMRSKVVNEIYRHELQELIERELLLVDLYARFKENDQPTEPFEKEAEKEAEDTLQKMRDERGIRTEREFIRILESQGLTLSVFRRAVERQLVAQQYVYELIKETGPAVSLAQIRIYYDLHAQEFKIADRVRWQDLFIRIEDNSLGLKERAHAEQVLQAVRGGKDFVELIKAEEKDTHGRQNWDGIGTTRDDVPPDVAPTVWSLKPGETSGILVTPAGFHIVKVVERVYSGKRPFDSAVQDECREKVKRRLAERFYKKLIDDLRQKYPVQIYEANTPAGQAALSALHVLALHIRGVFR